MSRPKLFSAPFHPGVTARLTFDDQMLKIKGILGLTEIQFKYLKLSVVAFLVLVSFALGVMFSKSVAKVTRQFKRRKRVWSVVISYTAVKEEAKKAGWFGFLKSQKKKSSAKTTSLKLTFKSPYAFKHSPKHLIEGFVKGFNKINGDDKLPLPSSACQYYLSPIDSMSIIDNDATIVDALEGVVASLRLVQVQKQLSNKKLPKSSKTPSKTPKSPVVFFKEENKKQSPVSKWLNY